MADEKMAAVYVSWITFKNAIEHLAEGIPNRIDRTTFPGLSGAVQSQLFTGLKFMGLMNDDGKPTPALEALAVDDEATRKEKLKQLLQEKYARVFALDLMKATPGELNDLMGEQYGVTGETKEKAVRFFLSAASYVGIPMSRFFKVPGATSASNGLKTRRRSPSGSRKAMQDDEPPETGKPSGTARTVQLQSGGTLTVSASLDLFQLSASDRTFVFGLIDKLEAYEKEATTETPRK